MEFGFITWCFYKGLVWRGIVAGILTAVLIGKLGPCKCWTGDRCKEEKAG